MKNKQSNLNLLDAVLGLTIAFIIVIAIVLIKNNLLKETVTESSEIVMKRTAPVSEVTLGEAKPVPVIEEPQVVEKADTVETDETKSVAAPETKTGKSETKIINGENIAKSSCYACHQTGVMQAPKIGDNADWSKRHEQGFDILQSHALNGFKNMPARGGNMELTDDEVKSALYHMLSASGLNDYADKKVEAPVSAPESEVAITEQPAPEDTSASPQTSPAPQLEEAIPEVTETTTESAEEVAVVEETNKTEEITIKPADNTVYNKACASCHDKGVNKAPRIGSKNDWLSVFNKNLGTVSREVVNTGSHPDIGNQRISQEQVSEAIQYILQQTYWPVK